MKETDLAELVIAWLQDQHWEVYQEVKFSNGSNGNVADIVAVRNGLVWIIECKTSMTFTVLAQANMWHSHFRSVAIPATINYYDKGRGMSYQIAKDYLHLGIIEVRNDREVKEVFCAPVMRENHEYTKKYYLPYLREEHKTFSKAGTKNGGYWTPYRQTIEEVKRFIYRNPGCTFKEIMNYIGRGHYSSTSSANSSLRIALTSWESSWCKYENTNGVMRFYFTEQTNDHHRM